MSEQATPPDSAGIDDSCTETVEMTCGERMYTHSRLGRCHSLEFMLDRLGSAFCHRHTYHSLWQ